METKDLRRFNYFYFEELSVQGKQNHFGESYSISMETFFDNQHFQGSFNINNREIYCLCRGQILDAQNRLLFDVGDSFSGGFLAKGASLKIQGKILLLTVGQKEGIGLDNENYSG